jgi:hypothetical protein
MKTEEGTAFVHDIDAVYAEHQRQARAVGRWLMYGLEDLRALVQKELAKSVCGYCQAALTTATVVVGHKDPIERGGKFSFRNLEVCCRECQVLKGVLDGQEWRQLLTSMQSWPKPIRKLFQARLRAGAGMVPAKLPPVGSLAWFRDDG